MRRPPQAGGDVEEGLFLVRSVAAGHADLDKFEDSVFSGEYITADISASYLEQLELFRADAAREDRRRKENAVLELHNDG